MDAIRIWLKSKTKDFAIGKALYFQWGKKQSLKDLFEMGETPFTRKKLEAALQELADSMPSAPATPVKPSADRPPQVLPSDREDAPEAVKKLIVRRKALYDQVKRLHERVYLMTVEHLDKYTDKERGTAAIELLRGWDEIETIWKRTNHYDREGKLPPEPPRVEVEIKPGDSLLRSILNKRSELSKTRKGIISKKDIATLEAELDELERMHEEEDHDDTVNAPHE